VRGEAIGCGQQRGIAAAGEGEGRGGGSGEVEPVLDPHRLHRPLYIAVDGGRMGAPATGMRAAGPLRALFCAKKAPDPQIGSGGAIRARMGVC
jgi:hypothetical protein